MMYFLSFLKLKHIPGAVFSDLLTKQILVRRFISGTVLKSKKLDLGLIKDFITLQNKLNKEEYFRGYNRFSINNSSQKDDGFFREETSRFFVEGPEKLAKLKIYNLQIVNKFYKIFKHLEKNKEQIIDDFSNMPFARQHHDFRDDNIVGKQQKLVDWGSSYGYGPFLFDLAAYLVNDRRGFEILLKHSDICKKSDRKKIERWLYVALAASFLGFLQWRIDIGANFKNKEECRKFLEYEYKPYKKLLEYSFMGPKKSN